MYTRSECGAMAEWGGRKKPFSHRLNFADADVFGGYNFLLTLGRPFSGRGRLLAAIQDEQSRAR